MLEIFPGAELIPDWDWSVPTPVRDRLIDLLSGRPSTLEEISRHLEIDGSDAIKYCKIMEKDSLISRRLHSGKLYFHATENPTQLHANQRNDSHDKTEQRLRPVMGGSIF